MENLSAKDAYRAMFRFLESYYERTQADDIGAILGSMAMLEDGKPADGAMWQEWLDAIGEICPGFVEKQQ